MLVRMLSMSDPDDVRRLYALAYAQKLRVTGRYVFFRGLIEVSNVCARNCLYCGIRAGNGRAARYTMSDEDILAAADTAFRSHFGSIVLQGGERSDAAFVDWIERLVTSIKAKYGTGLGITLSLGEQTPETYDRWKRAGAHRYLIRIESSDPDLFARIHPAGQSYDNRVACIDYLSASGWQTGSGVMIGLPGQTVGNLADDLLFFRDHNLDMIGMGPYIPHPDTPLTQACPDVRPDFHLAIRMVAAARLLLKDVNIAATTALQTLVPDGREQALLAGANVIMPNLGDPQYKRKYSLYEGKPDLNDGLDNCLNSLCSSIRAIGEIPSQDVYGDPVHFATRTAGR